MLKEVLENVRRKEPLIHSITNYVTVNDVANVVLAIGASPIMADDVEEVEEITSICQGLNINIGTLNKRTILAMIKAGRKANELEHPVVLDPVGVGASQLRTQTAFELIENVHFNVIKGNISEIKVLAFKQGMSHGVDANIEDTVTEENLEQSIAFVKDFACQTNSIIVVTGAIDLVVDKQHCFVIRNGEKEMSKITGTGCQLSALITAFISANEDQMLNAVAGAVCTMGLAGEIAKKNMLETDGNSTYRHRIIDAIYLMDGETLEKGAKYEIR